PYTTLFRSDGSLRLFGDPVTGSDRGPGVGGGGRCLLLGRGLICLGHTRPPGSKRTRPDDRRDPLASCHSSVSPPPATLAGDGEPEPCRPGDRHRGFHAARVLGGGGSGGVSPTRRRRGTPKGPAHGRSRPGLRDGLTGASTA